MGKTKEQLKEDFDRAKKAVRKKALRKKAVQKGEAAPSAIQQQLMEFQASTEEAFDNLNTEVGDLSIVNWLVQNSDTLHEHQEHLVEHDRKHKAADKKTKILEKKTKILEPLVSVVVIVLLAVVAAQVYDRADSLKSIFTPFFL